mmetsp:Transcript_41285/g.105575  ORF Transcript_41285/g.105575 Transcript_41285/m.105575 type:complete len:202 (+) Transcript_41285:817-1422(+)
MHPHLPAAHAHFGNHAVRLAIQHPLLPPRLALVAAAAGRRDLQVRAGGGASQPERDAARGESGGVEDVPPIALQGRHGVERAVGQQLGDVGVRVAQQRLRLGHRPHLCPEGDLRGLGRGGDAERQHRAIPGVLRERGDAVIAAAAAKYGGEHAALDVEARHQCVDACAAGQRHVAAKPLRLPGRGEQSSDAVAADLTGDVG